MQEFRFRREILASDDILGKKPRLVVLNKSDLADKAVTKMWLDWYKKNNIRGYPDKLQHRSGSTKYNACRTRHYFGQT